MWNSTVRVLATAESCKRLKAASTCTVTACIPHHLVDEGTLSTHLFHTRVPSLGERKQMAWDLELSGLLRQSLDSRFKGDGEEICSKSQPRQPKLKPLEC